MHIAQVFSGVVPPQGYGGVERVIQKKGCDEMLREVVEGLERCIEQRRQEKAAVA